MVFYAVFIYKYKIEKHEKNIYLNKYEIFQILQKLMALVCYSVWQGLELAES